MKFTAEQRLTLLSMMPTEGSYFNIKNLQKVKEALGFNDPEQKIFESHSLFVNGRPVSNWKEINGKIVLKKIDVGEWIDNHIRKELKKQYDEENATAVLWLLYKPT